MIHRIKDIIAASIDVKAAILGDERLLTVIQDVADECIHAYKRKNKVLFCGNGGSAADAQHLAAELCGRFYKDRPALFAEALHVNTSYITAVSNDYSFDEVYSRMLRGKGVQGDILFGISTSGNSKNVLNAFDTARNMEIITVGMTGFNGGELKNRSDFLINVPSENTPRIQEAHILIGHIICEFIESALFA